MEYSDAHQAGRRTEVGPSLTRGETARLDADQLGPYTLIAEISAGEFTTVHLARKRGSHGFDRLVAIKRLKPAYAKQPEWSQLLLDEARLGASVDHPNTVDILDVGTDAGVYVVMDYVEGADLEQLLARAGRERHPRFVLPPIIDALTGLHAIHTQKDELGEPLAMVHQAPRARHILVGIHGVARVTDFSQVTARGLIPSTLRGKGLSPAYMAPEQVLVSEPVSARTDIFILGITLWEALTGERLFSGETPSLVRRAITERDIPKPSEVGLHPPRCFDSIVMRALQRNPEARYQSAAELARELREVAQEEALLASASEMGQWVRALASRSLLERRRALGVDDRSEEIAIDVLEQHIAADRARNAADRESIPFARDSIVVEEDVVTGEVEDHELSPVIQVTPAITVTVSNPGKREPTAEHKAPKAELETPKAAPKRSPTGTLLGVTSKPRSVGLPPPAASLIKPGGTVPPYRGSLGRTPFEAPRIEIKPVAQLASSHTLPEGAAFISDIELPINLPSAKPERTPSFVGFSRVLDGEAADPALPAVGPKAQVAPASFGGAAAFVTEPLVVTEPVRTSDPLRDTQAYGVRDGSGTRPAASALHETAGYDTPLRGLVAPAPRQPVSFNDVTAPVVPTQAPSAESWATPHSQAWQAPAASESARTVLPPAIPGRKATSAAAWNEPTPAWEAPEAASAGPSSAPRRSDPPARSSRPSMHTLDGHVSKDVFDRLRAAGAGADSWRPPANAVQQPWPNEEGKEPRAYGRVFAIAAAIVVGGFFGFRYMTGEGKVRSLPPVHAARPAMPAAPEVASSRPAQEAAQPEKARPAAEQAPAAAVVPALRTAVPEQAAPVSPTSTFGRPAADEAPPSAKRIVPRAPVRREEQLARPEESAAPVSRPVPTQRLVPAARPAQPQPAPRARSAYSPTEALPDNPY